MVQTNDLGLLSCTHAILPSMVKRNQGTIINVGSVAGSYAYPGGHVYGTSKAFVQQFTRGLKADLLGTNVRVSCVEPGLVGGTEFSVTRFAGDKEKADKVYHNTKALSADDIADIIFWICSLPAHININSPEVMPVNQSFGPLQIFRK